MTRSKKCFKCNLVKPLSEFYRHSRMADGHLNKCKECAKRDTRENRLKRIGYYREYDRERGNRQGPEYLKVIRHKWPQQYMAQTALRNAIRSGCITASGCCESCGKRCATHGHHADYAKPLDVTWLCPACHSAWHKEHGPGKNRRAALDGSL